jgi:hypothetical protein
VKPKLMLRLFGLTLLLLAALPSAALASDTYSNSSSLAQDDGGTTLTYGTEVSGEITDTAFEQLWTLEAATADRIAIRVERAEGTLIPIVSVLDATGQEIASSFGPDETWAAAEIENVELPTAGTYQVRVIREDEETGVTTGTYTLNVSLIATAEDHPNNTTPVGEVSYESAVQGNVTPNRWRNLYTLQAPGADVIRVQVERTSGSYQPYIELLDTNGSVISSGYGYSSDSSDFAEIERIELPAAGQYSIMVGRYNGFDGTTVGGFNLTVTLLGAGEDNPVLTGNPPGEASYGTPLAGELSHSIWYQDWSLNLTSTDRISLTVTRTGGNLIPRVTLLGGSGQDLYTAYEDETYSQTILDNYSFDVAGTFTIRVWRANGKTGATTGTYDLVVTLEGAGENAETMQGVTGAITKGESAQGEITNARWADTWTYEGTSGEVIDITVERTNGTLIPLLEIQDSNGQPIRSAYVEDTGNRASITQFTIPSNGQYRIVVLRLNEQGGATTGEFSLTVTDTPASQ